MSTNVHWAPDVILNTKIHEKKFGSHNESLTQSVHHRENTKIQLITTIQDKQERSWLILQNLPASVKDNH